MSYDPKRRRKHSFSKVAARALRLAHSRGISLKSAWKVVRGHDPSRQRKISSFSHHSKTLRTGPRGGSYFVGPRRKRYDMKRRSHHRRHDPLRIGGGGLMGKLMHGVELAVGGLIGNYGAGFVKAAVPQATIPITSNKGINLAAFGAGVAIGGFGPKSGALGTVLQGVGAGLGAGSDPVASSLGGGAMRPLGTGSYGSLGV